ncbi:MAG TPA: helix-turn-helix transcriptional regulator [Gammaproteobacteria bacterium]|nr:helix-turn-helix transcriptional regulator [Gammaproteobacteria bacterium]
MKSFFLSEIKDQITFEQKIAAVFKEVDVMHHKQLPDSLVAILIKVLTEELGITPGIAVDNPLSLREMLCLILLATGKSPEQCAVLLNITANTFSSYLKRIHKKLRVRNRMQALFIALQKGYLQIYNHNKIMNSFFS